MNKARLLKLAEHLAGGKLSVDKFDIECYRSKNPCGTAGCALGECPAVWPEDWKLGCEFDRDMPVLRAQKSGRWSDFYPMDGPMEWFEIGLADVISLFHALPGDPARLQNTATAADVAARIRRFVGTEEKHE